MNRKPEDLILEHPQFQRHFPLQYSGHPILQKNITVRKKQKRKKKKEKKVIDSDKTCLASKGHNIFNLKWNWQDECVS